VCGYSKETGNERNTKGIAATARKLAVQNTMNERIEHTNSYAINYTSATEKHVQTGTSGQSWYQELCTKVPRQVFTSAQNRAPIPVGKQLRSRAALPCLRQILLALQGSH
jgi:hypothetical protein